MKGITERETTEAETETETHLSARHRAIKCTAEEAMMKHSEKPNDLEVRASLVSSGTDSVFLASF